MIQNLIDTGSSFEVVLDLIANSQELIDSKLSQLKVAAVYRERLKEYQVRCRKKMEGECLSLVDQLLRGRLQYKPPKIAGNQEYR